MEKNFQRNPLGSWLFVGEAPGFLSHQIDVVRVSRLAERGPAGGRASNETGTVFGDRAGLDELTGIACGGSRYRRARKHDQAAWTLVGRPYAPLPRRGTIPQEWAGLELAWESGTNRSTIELSPRLALVRQGVVHVFAPDMSFYPVLTALVGALIGSETHLSSLRSITSVVWSLLWSQSLHASDLGRALPDSRSLCARQRMRRVGRVLGRKTLSSEFLTPVLIQIVLRLVKNDVVTAVIDSTRCVRWDIFTIGIAFRGRVLPFAWAILPYPWPKKTYTPTIIALIERAFENWPENRRVVLVADRGFPSLRLFRLLDTLHQRLPLDYVIRVRAGDWVRLPSGQSIKLADLMEGLVPSEWKVTPAAYQHRKNQSSTVTLVLGKSDSLPPPHQRGPADRARRRARDERRIAHLKSKGQPNAARTDRVWALLTTFDSAETARGFYELRFHTEGTYRDLKTWGLEAVASLEADARQLAGLFGLAVLTYLIQALVGAMAGCATLASAQARQQQWCTTDRLSIFWRGRQVLHDGVHDWRPWLKSACDDLNSQLNHEPRSIKRRRRHPPHPPTPIPQRAKEAA